MNGVVGSVIDVRAPGRPPRGALWVDPPQRLSITAGEIGQVFGIAFDDGNPANVYLTATSAFGLHRSPDNANWMAGMWGRGGGPGTVWKLSAANNYRPEIFGQVALDGRANTGAALGNIAFDRWNQQLYVSDLETGMIHRLRLADGAGLGRYDHGTQGRTNFVDAGSGTHRSLPQVAFNPRSRARIADCAAGTFAQHSSCWNFADFRRRVWGLGVRRDDRGGEVRLYYSVWSSQGFGDPAWFTAGDDQSNAIWSVRIAADGDFDPSDVRREFMLPNFFSDLAQIAGLGASHPVSDIAFPKVGAQSTMLIAERGGVRNLGLNTAAPFARPHESRVLRYELDRRGLWQPAGRYDVGYYDRKGDGQPYLRANAAGGVAFGFGYSATGLIDQAQADQFVWMTGDRLCSPDAPCPGGLVDMPQVHGLQGTPAGRHSEVAPKTALQPYPDKGYVTPQDTARASFMIATDVSIDAAGNPVVASIARNNATKIGDIEVFVPAVTAAAPPQQIALPRERPPAAPGVVPEPGVVPGIPSGEGAVPGLPPAPPPTPPAPSPPGFGEWGGPGKGPPSPPGFGQWGGPGAAPPPAPPGAGAWGGPGAVYDLAIDKSAPHAAQAGAPGAGALHVCAAMQPCPFTITITNVGNAKFEGPFRFTDTMPPGWSYASASTGWSCTAGGGNAVSCARSLALEPGQTVSLELKVNPAGGVPLQPVQAENCAEIDWSYTKKGGAKGTVRSCAPVILAPTAPTLPGVAEQPAAPGDAADITVRKELVSGCEPGGECTFNVTIRGTHDQPLKDKFTVHDLLPDTWTFAGGGKLDLWTCSTDQKIWTTCRYDIARNPGFPANGFTKDKAVLTEIRIRPPADAPEGEYKNCISIEFETPPTGEIRKSPKYFCAIFSLAYRSKMTIEKRFDQAVCVPGAPCPLTITIKNAGAGAYDGMIKMRDTLGPGPAYEVERVDSGDIDCRGVVGQQSGLWTPAQPKKGEFLCISSTRFDPGTTKVISVTGRFAADGKDNSATNCSTLEIARSKPGKLSTDEQTTLVKQFLQHKGYPISAGAEFSAQDRLALSSYKKDTSFKDGKGAPDRSGDINDDLLKSILPSHDDQIFETGESAAELDGLLIVCADVALGQPGLVIEKRGPPASDFGTGGVMGSAEAKRCRDDHVCRFTIKVSGNSEAPFTDPIIIDDTSSNLWTLKGYKGAGWSCTGTTKYTCIHPPANLTKGQSLELTLELAPSQAFYQSEGNERYPWIYNCAKVRYKSTQQYTLQKRGDYESCYRVRLVGSDRSAVEYVATGTGSCLPPNCSYYEFTAIFQVHGDPRPGGAVATDYDPTGTGACLPPNCGGAAPAAAQAGRYVGPLSIAITPPPGSAFPQARISKAPASCSAARWSCTKSGNDFLCRIAECAMSSGDQVAARIDGRIAPDLTEPPPVEQKRTACSVVEWQQRGGDVDIDIEQRGGKRTKNACFTTTILARAPVPPKPTPTPVVCRGGKITVGDQCVCPEGTIDLRGRCVACPDGKVAVGNRCVCPSGTIERRGICVQPPAPAPVQPRPLQPQLLCLGGKVAVGNRCVCPPNTIEMRGRCVPRQAIPPSPAPAPSQVRPQVVPAPLQQPPHLQTVPGQIVCPQGTRLIQGRCMPIIR